MGNFVNEFSWCGDQENFVDNINIKRIGYIQIGRFGGNSSAGQYKNEDGCLVWVDKEKNWEFAVILDAHNSAESVHVILKHFSMKKTELHNLFYLTCEQVFEKIEETILSLFKDESFLADCRNIQGETACLIIFRKDKYIWWFSVGDCLSFLFHSELAQLTQYQLNQRQFYEWIGQVNTFEQTVPCYSSGRRELRVGVNRIFLTTDGLIECPNKTFSAQEIYTIMTSNAMEKGIEILLQTIKENNVRDSTTIISWDVDVSKAVTRPSNE
ncbi:protein phosphatase 2C domain-containing protein [Bacillus ndiopicus]|uniref:protein phosphatase 2C domain-containing protein n=1 Tax=Bacillus ndiopicus TaxID=1347368 RepID=UPI0005A8D463|nr:protein phosphatase 2C domain-containing protein [Bacillus ndiopicus]